MKALGTILTYAKSKYKKEELLPHSDAFAYISVSDQMYEPFDLAPFKASYFQHLHIVKTVFGIFSDYITLCMQKTIPPITRKFQLSGFMKSKRESTSYINVSGALKIINFNKMISFLWWLSWGGAGRAGLGLEFHVPHWISTLNIACVVSTQCLFHTCKQWKNG